MLELLYIAFAGMVVASLYDDCLDEGMVFERWGRVVRSGKWYYKPLGGCLQCTTIWVTAGMYVAWHLAPAVFAVLAVLGAANLMVKMQNRYI